MTNEFSLPPEQGEPASSPVRELRRAYLRVGLGLFLFLLVPQILSHLLAFVAQSFAPAILDIPHLAWIVQVVFLYLIAFPIAFFVIGRPTRPLLVRDGERVSFLLPFTVFCLMLACARVGSVISGILSLLVKILFSLQPSDPIGEMLNGTPLWIVALVAAVLGPIVEELLLRYAVMERLLPFGERGAILFSAVAFGLMHGNLYQLFYAVGIGVLLGYLYARTRKILYSAVLHVLFNLLGSVVPLAFAPLLEQFTAGNITPEFVIENYPMLLLLAFYLFLQLALPVAGAVLLIVFFRRIHIEKPLFPLRALAYARAMLLNAGVILFALLVCFELATSLIP